MEHTAPDISVIIPIYNVEEYLEACLDSVVEQTKDNLEVILIDDGSQDGSSESQSVMPKRILIFITIARRTAAWVGHGMWARPLPPASTLPFWTRTIWLPRTRTRRCLTWPSATAVN